MEIDFFSFDSFELPSDLAGCTRVVCSVSSVRSIPGDRENCAQIILLAKVEEPAAYHGENFVFMVKEFRESESVEPPQGALGYVSFIGSGCPEDEGQLSGACFDADAELFERFKAAAEAASPAGVSLELETKFPAFKPIAWCSMGVFTSCLIKRGDQAVASAAQSEYCA